ncbi:CapA family protein [Caminicella sporogenes]|uniref:CapA family protein n=1 Tax=Caminicella sporogenes TaxID=166485 RepID=UPI002541B1FE|nr:CapA family protein [Caminicella sporogenes]WIF94061.1 CapA family protein [Caminicella sporogenes]
MFKKLKLFLCTLIIFHLITIPIFAQEKIVKISLAGDVLLAGNIGKLIETYGSNYPWKHVKNIFKSSDLSIVNLETSIGINGKPYPNKKYTFQAKPEALLGLLDAGIDGVSIANNHTLDYGIKGFMDTLKNLERLNIQYAGGGRNIEDAKKAVIWDIKGIKIGFLAFSRVIPNVNWYAGKNKPGLLGAYDCHADDVLNLVKTVKKDVDFLIVSIHWGKELKSYPQPSDIIFAKKLIDSGADCIMGHHPHVLQGIQFYKNRPIIYSLGNFIFSSKSKQCRQSIIFNLEICKDGIVDTNIIPISIKNGQPIPFTDKTEIINYLNVLSKKWNTKFFENGKIQGNIYYISPKENTLKNINSSTGSNTKNGKNTLLEFSTNLIKKLNSIKLTVSKNIKTILNKML